MGRTFAAFGPLGPSCASNSTLAPSSRVLKPEPEIAEWWTNRSFPRSSGVMKPKPLSLLNHFTVPVAMSYLRLINAASRGGADATTANRSHCVCAGRASSYRHARGSGGIDAASHQTHRCGQGCQAVGLGLVEDQPRRVGDPAHRAVGGRLVVAARLH